MKGGRSSVTSIAMIRSGVPRTDGMKGAYCLTTTRKMNIKPVSCAAFDSSLKRPSRSIETLKRENYTINDEANSTHR